MDDNDTKRMDLVEETMNNIFVKAKVTDVVPVTLHDPLTPEDMWNMIRAMRIAEYGFDPGPYPGDEFIKNQPTYRHYKYINTLGDTPKPGREVEAPKIAATLRTDVPAFQEILGGTSIGTKKLTIQNLKESWSTVMHQSDEDMPEIIPSALGILDRTPGAPTRNPMEEPDVTFIVVFIHDPLDTSEDGRSRRETFIKDCLEYDDLVDRSQIITPPWIGQPVIFRDVSHSVLDTIIEISKDDYYHDWDFADEDFLARAIAESDQADKLLRQEYPKAVPTDPDAKCICVRIEQEVDECSMQSDG